jgi:carbon storage regulator CsrA
MLVLSRRNGESIVIDDRIRVQVDRILGSRVRLLIDAPEQVRVDRGEVWLRKRDGNELPIEESTN